MCPSTIASQKIEIWTRSINSFVQIGPERYYGACDSFYCFAYNKDRSLSLDSMNKILFFDGYCSLCNCLVDMLIRVDALSQLKFASLQGSTAKEILKLESNQPMDLNTVLYWRDGVIYNRSTAVLMIFNDVKGIWGWLRVFLFAPKFLRDSVYRVVANNRYRLFGRRDTCRIPLASEKERFLP